MGGALRSSRDSGSKKREQEPAKTDSSGVRLLNSALQSSRFPTQQTGKRRFQEDQHEPRNRLSRDLQSRLGNAGLAGDEGQGMKRSRLPAPPAPSAPRGPPPTPFAPNMPADPNNPMAYFEEMNRIAVASGFRNAQEMIASQKELMAMMAPSAQMPPMPYFPSAHPSQAFYPPVPPGGFHPSHSGFYAPAYPPAGFAPVDGMAPYPMRG